MSLPLLYKQNTPPTLPLYVTPRVSMMHPTPPSSTTLLFEAPFPSTRPLVWGQKVQLFLVNPLAHTPSTFLLPPSENYPTVPLAFRGRIAGERTRQGGYVEIVVTNENPLERARRALILVSAALSVMPPPDLADMIAQRLASINDTQNGPPAEPARLSTTPPTPPAPAPAPVRSVPVLLDLPRQWSDTSGLIGPGEDEGRSATPRLGETRAPTDWAGPLYPRDPVWTYPGESDALPTGSGTERLMEGTPPPPPDAARGYDVTPDDTEPRVFYTASPAPPRPPCADDPADAPYCAQWHRAQPAPPEPRDSCGGRPCVECCARGGRRKAPPAAHDNWAPKGWVSPS